MLRPFPISNGPDSYPAELGRGPVVPGLMGTLLVIRAGVGPEAGR